MFPIEFSLVTTKQPSVMPPMLPAHFYYVCLQCNCHGLCNINAAATAAVDATTTPTPTTTITTTITTTTSAMAATAVANSTIPQD